MITTTIPPRRRTFRYGFSQSFFAIGVEIRGRLIEHHQKWITIERTGEPDTLTLSGRKRHSRLTNFRSVPIGKGENEIVRARGASCFQYGSRCRMRIKTRDIDRNTAVEELDILRQIPNVPAESYPTTTAPAWHCQF